VPDRTSMIILLCEDDLQEQLVVAYLKRCGIETASPVLVRKNPSRTVHGGNVTWVIREFPKEFEAVRKRHESRANTLLIVVVDADNKDVTERARDLTDGSLIGNGRPLLLLIPKRHIETWIRSALGDNVDETSNYKKPPIGKSEVREAAKTIHGWARDVPPAGQSCAPSLRDALPNWRKLC